MGRRRRRLPYAAGELLARVRERGTVELEYGERDVRVDGRVAPALAGELDGRGRALGRGGRRGGRERRGGRRRAIDDRPDPAGRLGPRPTDGSTVTWTVAEGRKGRRWREVVAARRRVRPRAAARDRSRSAGSATSSSPAPTGCGPSTPSPTGRSTATTCGRRRRRPARPGLAVRAATTRWSSRARRSPSAAHRLARVDGSARPARRRRSAGVVIGADGELEPRGGAPRRARCRRRAGGSATAPRSTSIADGLPVLDGGVERGRSSSDDRPFVDRLWTTGPSGARFVANSWISPYPGPRRVGYRRPCSKGPQTESGVADANQRR